ncbi:MAG: hypothetical protein NTV28_17180 [Propionibacteriales bacterium]|nr:hypothetical protein [Propionibacteriales bacterium]
MSEPGGREPFWDVVRRRHPDVDVVLLPPAGTTPPPVQGDPVTAEEAHGVADRLDHDFAALWQMLLGTAPEGSPVRWISGLVPGTARPVRSQRSEHVPLDLVGTARSSLADLGWTTSEPPAGLSLLVAEREGRELQLTVHDDAARLEVRGTTVPIASRTLRALRAEERA